MLELGPVEGQFWASLLVADDPSLTPAPTLMSIDGFPRLGGVSPSQGQVNVWKRTFRNQPAAGKPGVWFVSEMVPSLDRLNQGWANPVLEGQIQARISVLQVNTFTWGSTYLFESSSCLVGCKSRLESNPRGPWTLSKGGSDGSRLLVADQGTVLCSASPGPMVEKIAASEQTVSLEKEDVLKELLHSDLSSPTGISATCRRPIKGAAERPVTSSQLWNESLLFSPLATQTASVVENRITNRLAGVPRSSGLNSSPSRPVFAPPSAGQSKALSRGTFPWVKLLLLAVLAALFFFIYQTMEPNSISPFNVAEVGGARDENP
ncbi:uncharacterized protein LOC130519259 isoform X3 [Takifugu flavidus]|uniref:uncharacterized protein LOC130519259 isoform X3 n=1 Tax=Takifugu flavidus TaxID=433684 RepID=UPI0025444890|nr:uncharacterized protein LOC130519259 isoform X3 [Takifugu flavidus]